MSVREQILQATLDLCARRGIAATSLQDIADASNCSKANVVYHFSHKEELIDAALGSTRPIIVLSALTMAALHFAVWAWNPRWLAPLSLGALIVQIVSLGSVVPIEILPGFYQAISGATPLGWTTDALIASLAGGEISRVIIALVSLAVLTVVAYILSALILRSKRTLATQTQVGLQA